MVAAMVTPTFAPEDIPEVVDLTGRLTRLTDFEKEWDSIMASDAKTRLRRAEQAEADIQRMYDHKSYWEDKKIWQLVKAVKVTMQAVTPRLDKLWERVDMDEEQALKQADAKGTQLMDQAAPLTANADGPPTTVKSPFGSIMARKESEVQETIEAEPSTPSAETSQKESSAQALEEAPTTSGQEPEATLQDGTTTGQEVTSDKASTECKCLVCTYGPAEPVSEQVPEHVPAAMSPVEPSGSCKDLVCTYSPAEQVEETTTEHVHAAMSPTTLPRGCKPDDSAPGDDPAAEAEEEPSVVASTKDRSGEPNSADPPSEDASAETTPATSSQDQPPADFTADLCRQVAAVKQKAQTEHRGRPPDDDAAEPGPQPQDRPPDRFKEGARGVEQMPSYAWHLMEERRCKGPLLWANNVGPRVLIDLRVSQ